MRFVYENFRGCGWVFYWYKPYYTRYVTYHGSMAESNKKLALEICRKIVRSEQGSVNLPLGWSVQVQTLGGDHTYNPPYELLTLCDGGPRHEI